MNAIEELGGVSGNPSREGDRKEFSDAGADSACFDASQYAFFGKDVVEDIELGSLEDHDRDLAALVGDLGISDDEYDFPSFSIGEKGQTSRPLSEIDDLATTYAKLSRNVSEPRNAGIIGDRGRSFSRESSSTVDWTQEPDFSNWSDQQILDTEIIQDAKRWWSQPQSSSDRHSKSLYRTSSYPEQLLLPAFE
ncbi:hypothetical protein HPP92_019563 [Vanilla planifolia]|uniref:Uncharacterized protein n=1 Tax=Vanilla planifolia TaxID=51239 RepID=A0A835UHP0_VANPL|nr:hypothetical protein HPP92_019563 [Vanilla planifolia]